MLHERLVQGAAEFGDAPCIVEAETGRSLTYAECLAAVQAVRGLLGNDGAHGVVMMLASGMVSAIVWLGALTGGHTLLPLPPDAKTTERARAVRLARPDVLVVERREDAELFETRTRARVLAREDCERAIAHAIARVCSSPAARIADLMPPGEGRVCLMTSGSTGEPKGVFLTEPQIAWTADAIRRSHQLSAADRGLTVLPFFHVNAPVVSLCTSILAGGCVVIARRFSRSRFWEWIERYQITWASIVPTILAMLLETERPAYLPGKLRFVRTASAPLPVVHLLAFEHRFGIPVVETYGLSEAAATVSATPVPPGVRKPGSVGLPVGVEIRICRQRTSSEAEPLQDVAQEETGEICVRGPSVISAYAGGAGATSFQDGWFRTGDLGHQDQDGYLYITGRLRDVIIRGGENIAPREIEEVLLADPLVRDAAVVGRPDPLYGQQVVAYIVPKGKWTPEREQALRAYCAEHLSAFKIPEMFVPVRVLPRTRSGKIQRHRLSGMLAGGLRASVAANVAANVTQTVARLRQVARPITQPITRPIRRAVEGSSPRLYVARATPTDRTRGADAQPAARDARQVATLPPRTRPENGAPAPVPMGNGRKGHDVPANHNGHAHSEGDGKRRPYLHELDPIRVVTALAVVAVHVMTFTLIFNATGAGAEIQIGLGSALHFTREIFMFTTAFVLVYTYAGKPFAAKTFARKRGIGVVVPYVLWSLIYLAINRPALSPTQFTLAAVKAVVTGNASYQLYYILLTIQFYLLFPLLLLLLPRMRQRQWLVLGVSGALEVLALALDYAFVQTPPFVNTHVGFYLDAYQDRFVLVYQFYFVLGALAALNLDRVRAFLVRWGGVVAVAMSVGLAMFWLNFALAVWWLHQDIYYATSVLQPELVPYSLVVLAFLGWLACRWALARRADAQPRGARFLRTLADASFGIYLVHPLFISFALKFIAPVLPVTLPVALRVLVVWSFVAVGSCALSVGLMKTPLLSRLVGRPSTLPASWRRVLTFNVRRTRPAAVADVLDAYATAPVPIAPAGRSGSRELTITVTASSARHTRPRLAAVSSNSLPAPTRQPWGEGWGDGWAVPPSADVTREGAPSGGPSGGPRSARVTVELASVRAASASGARKRTDARANRDDRLARSQPGDSMPQRGPDSRGQREERRRRALDLREQGWRRKDIAARLGVSRSTVGNWFRQEYLRRNGADHEGGPQAGDGGDTGSYHGSHDDARRESGRDAREEAMKRPPAPADIAESEEMEGGEPHLPRVERASATASR